MSCIRQAWLAADHGMPETKVWAVTAPALQADIAIAARIN